MVVMSAKRIIFDPKNGGIIVICIENTSITKNDDNKSIAAVTL
jgi:hypothetical protein